MEIKVSIIIPIYNAEKFLSQALDTIVNQTLKDIEIICVDDGSTDSSLDILKSYQEKDNRIIILKQKNQFTGVARNNGIKKATGKYIIVLDADDYFELDMLETMYNKAEEDNSDIVVCEWCSFNNFNRKSETRFRLPSKLIKKSPFSGKSIAPELFTFCKPNTWTKLIKRSFFEKYDLYFESTKCYNDMTCIFLALGLAERISLIDKCFIHYRNNQNDNLTSQRKKNFDSLLIAISRLETRLKEHNIYDIYKTYFISHIKQIFNNRILKLDKPERDKLKIEAKDILSEDLYNTLYIEQKTRIIILPNGTRKII